MELEDISNLKFDGRLPWGFKSPLRDQYLEVMKMIILEENILFEMAQVSKKDTKLPYNLWIDSVGKGRNVPHNTPRLKVDVDGDLIPVSIQETPEILVNKTFPYSAEIFKYVKKYLQVFLKHWNNEITDKEALNILGEK